ncbi:MAG: DUF3298 domain-containing protein [Paludibacteraceae bacterium]|nr:DUF3298 domain-containing protein [Paludibacteraceae bacterium]
MRKDILYSWLTIVLVGLIAALCSTLQRIAMPHVVCKEYSFDKVAYLSEGQESSLTFSIRYAYPVAVNAPEEVLSKLQRAVCQTVLGEAFLDMRPQQAIEAYAALKHTEYIQNNLPLLQEWAIDHEDEPLCETCFNEELIISAAPMTDHLPESADRFLWSYAMDVYEYTGGAHGNRYLLIQNYDLETGDMVNEQDLFIDDYYEPLKTLLLNALIAQTDNAESKRDLRRMGYSVADVVPNENFYVTQEGITYVYNPYEIAPYAMGCIEIFLPWETVRPLIR